MPRWLAILAAVPLALLLVAAVATVEDFPAAAYAKLTEGGLWTGLVLFLALAAVMAFRTKPGA